MSRVKVKTKNTKAKSISIKDISLAPCPFCGWYAAHIIKTVCLDNNATLYHIYHSTSSICLLSETHGKNYDTPEEAARAWNRRSF